MTEQATLPTTLNHIKSRAIRVEEHLAGQNRADTRLPSERETYKKLVRSEVPATPQELQQVRDKTIELRNWLLKNGDPKAMPVNGADHLVKKIYNKNFLVEDEPRSYGVKTDQFIETGAAGSEKVVEMDVARAVALRDAEPDVLYLSSVENSGSHEFQLHFSPQGTFSITVNFYEQTPDGTLAGSDSDVSYKFSQLPVSQMNTDEAQLALWYFEDFEKRHMKPSNPSPQPR